MKVLSLPQLACVLRILSLVERCLSPSAFGRGLLQACFWRVSTVRKNTGGADGATAERQRGLGGGDEAAAATTEAPSSHFVTKAVGGSSRGKIERKREHTKARGCKRESKGHLIPNNLLLLLLLLFLLLFVLLLLPPLRRCRLCRLFVQLLLVPHFGANKCGFYPVGYSMC
jgi:hypothetical protein